MGRRRWLLKRATSVQRQAGENVTCLPLVQTANIPAHTMSAIRESQSSDNAPWLNSFFCRSRVL